jgi:hypothetical protein
MASATASVTASVTASATIIYPQRLVMIQLGDNCMFCIEQKGDTYTRYVDFHNKLGYIYCRKCEEYVTNAINIWKERIAFGSANYLKNKYINVRRSTGEIEPGWILDSPILSNDINGNETIHCYNDKLNLGKWCTLKEILELNPPTIL